MFGGPYTHFGCLAFLLVPLFTVTETFFFFVFESFLGRLHESVTILFLYVV